MGLAEKMNKSMEKYGDKKRESFERTTSIKLVRSTYGSDKIFIVEEYRFWVEDYSDCTNTLHAFLRKEDAIGFIKEYASHKESAEFSGEYAEYTETKEDNTFVCTLRILEIPFKA